MNYNQWKVKSVECAQGGIRRADERSVIRRMASLCRTKRCCRPMLGRTAPLNACTVLNALTDGRLQSLTNPSGRVLQLAYDSAGRVSSLAFTPYQIASNIAYHPFGGIRSITLLNGIVHHRGQDTNGWPQGYTLGEQPLDFGYDLAGRISGVDQNGTAYDGLGRRVSKSGPAMLVPGGFVRYVYDVTHHLVGEYKADGTPIKEYVWIGDLPVAVIETHPDSTTTAYAIETDHLGTPRLLTDATRAPRWRWTSPPFGEVLPEDNPSGLGAVTFNLRFPGQYFDKETGLHYNFNRYYDPGTGRYDQSDPIGLQGGWNTYSYVGGNPLSYADPTGLIKWNGKVFGGALTPFSMPLKLGKWGFAAGFFRYRYELHSDCVRGQRWKVIVLADGKLAGWGIPGTLVGSSASFDDGENGYIDPYVFNGVYQSLSGGISLGAGPSYAGTAMGRAYSKAGIALEAGIDEGFGAFVGNSKVVSATPEPCACKE
ncbi:MAG: hypothetical protein DWQ11_04540 [Proteobacteria bacterium]|nr:MAG: hypothetical protein DWQ11_04540 [Pseudomonadota bacterium]